MEEEEGKQVQCPVCLGTGLQLLEYVPMNNSTLLKFVCLSCGSLVSWNTRGSEYTPEEIPRARVLAIERLSKNKLKKKKAKKKRALNQKLKS